MGTHMQTRAVYEPKILIVLAGDDLVTPELAAALHEDERATYRHCRHLAELGLLKPKESKSHHRMFYCFDCKDVVKPGDVCHEEHHHVAPFFPKAVEWKLTDAGKERLRQLHPKADLM